VIGRSIVRLMVIAPFFVMPTVSARWSWKNLLMHPVSGLFRLGSRTLVGATYPIDLVHNDAALLLAVILIVGLAMAARLPPSSC